ncbi:hypothetical protein VTL71DRAFT_16366 [Oculimacula yallundae]|uniref:Heterokaryon incompatibility domain-containing protein n=1 Tax=Oculimacula yallundae TaxID=86028 RepID=A0ABR4CE98_9HELO
MLQENEIRILDILPYGDDGPQAPIRCERRVENLFNNPVYDALSYRWGDPESRIPVSVDEQEFFVTNNLHAALLRVRQKVERKSMWIDQLCIAQQDQAEKSVQVRLMRKVYAQCRECLIWMDEIDKNATLADAQAIIEVLEFMADHSLPVPACLASPATFRDPSLAWSSISLDVHPWWDRIWTTQEVILPSRKAFLWGPLRLSWDTLTACAYAWTGHQGSMPAEMSSLIYETHLSGPLSGGNRRTDYIMGPLFTNVIWVNMEHREIGHPVSTLIKWCERKASDPRDKVFGLLGLLPSGMNLHYTSQCDHRTPTAKVYIAFTMDLILHCGDLLPLMVQRRKPLSNLADGLPTWAYDLTDGEKQIRSDRYYLWGMYVDDERHNACANQPLDHVALTDGIKSWESPNSVASPTLGLTGVAVDFIVATGPRITAVTGEDSVNMAETLRIWYGIVREYHQMIKSGKTESELARAFYRALVVDRIRGGINNAHERRPNDRDFAEIAHFVETGHGTLNGIWFWDRYVGMQTFFITKDGTMGMGNMDVEAGDEVWVVGGCRMPLAIRKLGDGGADDFIFVCCCYLSGIMDGEVYGNPPRRTTGQNRAIWLH